MCGDHRLHPHTIVFRSPRRTTVIVYVYMHTVFAQVATWHVSLARCSVVRLNRAVHRVMARGSMEDVVTTGANFLTTINSAITQARERRRVADIHMNAVRRLILECQPNAEDVRCAFFRVEISAVYSRTERQTIIDAIVDLMRPGARAARRDPALLGWSRPHEQLQSCEEFCSYFTAPRWALIKDPKVPIEQVFTIIAKQAFDIGLRNPFNATFVRMLAIVNVSGRPIPREAFWDRLRALKQVFYAFRITKPFTMWYVPRYPCSAMCFAEIFPDCYPGFEPPICCPLSRVDMAKFVQAMPIRGCDSSTDIGPQSTIDGCAPSAPPLDGATPQQSSSDIIRETQPGSSRPAAVRESEILRETQFKGNGMQNPAVPSPPAARTDDADEPRASGTSSAASLEVDLAMVADWHVKQEDRTEVSHASSARDVSCMAQAVDDHRGKRPREHSLDPAAYRVRKTHALPVNPDIDPPFPGTEWHPPISFCTVTIHMDVSQGRWLVKPAWPYTKKTFGWRTDPVRTWAAVVAFAKDPHFD